MSQEHKNALHSLQLVVQRHLQSDLPDKALALVNAFQETPLGVATKHTGIVENLRSQIFYSKGDVSSAANAMMDAIVVCLSPLSSSGFNYFTQYLRVTATLGIVLPEDRALAFAERLASPPPQDGESFTWGTRNVAAAQLARASNALPATTRYLKKLFQAAMTSGSPDELNGTIRLACNLNVYADVQTEIRAAVVRMFENIHAQHRTATDLCMYTIGDKRWDDALYYATLLSIPAHNGEVHPTCVATSHMLRAVIYYEISASEKAKEELGRVVQNPSLLSHQVANQALLHLYKNAVPPALLALSVADNTTLEAFMKRRYNPMDLFAEVAAGKHPGMTTVAFVIDKTPQDA